MQSFDDFAAHAGIPLGQVSLDGKILRYGKNKNKWFVGWKNISESGGEFINAVAGDWATNEKIEFKSSDKLSKIDIKKIKEQHQAAAQKVQEEQEIVAKEARHEWQHASPTKSFAYLVRKELHGHYNTKTQLYENGRALLIPCTDINGIIWGLQKIFANGEKRFMSGQKVSGTFFKIGEWSQNIYICEGFATGASIYEAMGGTVIVSFNAGNMANVAKIIKQAHESAKITVCGDADPTNVGQKAAMEAARVCGGRVIIVKTDDGTDFNDLHVKQGINEVRNQLEPKKENIYIALGFDDIGHHFFEPKNRVIVSMSAVSDTGLLNLMPLEYWFTMFPSKAGVAWIEAKNHVIQQSRAKGLFNRNLIRGTGVWLDRGKTIINLGSHIIGETKGSKYTYIQTQNAIPEISANKLTTNESQKLVDACTALKWTDPKNGFLLAGWLTIARIAGALPVRPHVWITGGAGTGKSTVMDGLVNMALGHESGRIYFQGGTTEAGIRQRVKADSIPIIFDEFETTNEASKTRVESIIELLRQSWSQTQGHIVKGSASGEAQQFSLGFAALVSSIRVSLNNDADRSRFAVLELAKHDNNEDQWKSTREKLSCIDEQFGEKLFSRAISNINNIISSYEIFKSELSKIINQRAGQQFGMLLAGWYSLVDDIPVTNEAAKSVIKDLGFGVEKEEAKDTDEIECLDQILTTRIQLQNEVGNRVDKTVSQIVEDGSGAEIESLKNYGLLVKNRTLFVCNSHATLKKTFFQGTRWESCWPKSLGRLPNAEKGHFAKISGKSARGTLIKL